ncbi:MULTISPECIES: hypothetical protein [unclassified Crossiella]|uniref:hypothetical protein n=1 Tax=unclassified Crossiella TaxID=2620835 RepID=UPI001FFEB8A0|nr:MULTISPECIES: hypothetical protein [unclassified Crossiella]MCK2242972.1 hypothetical protein [Crossiella sp. S99.2]MCK2256849.1 hypothetical protein [Crossiella sp. S99.1]
MTGLDRAGTAAARLHAVARADLYRQNPFLRTGVPTDAPGRLVRQRRQQALTAAPDPLLRAAFDLLEQTEQRLVAELFWHWGEPGDCGCPAEAHRLHDAAIRAHAEILDLEEQDAVRGPDRARRWTEAARAWAEALAHQDFWGHVGYRVRALRDRRLDESTVDGLRDGFAAALLGPQVALAAANRDAELIALLEVWAVEPELADQARVLAAEAELVRGEALHEELGALQRAEEPAEAGRRAVAELIPLLDWLDIALPRRRFWRADRFRDSVAVLLNNCAMAEGVELAQTEELLAAAVEVAVDKDTRTAIEQNRANLAESGVLRQVHTLLNANRFADAVRELLQLRAVTTEPADRAAIDGLLDEVNRVFLSTNGPNDESARAGVQSVSALILLCLALIPTVAYLILPAGREVGPVVFLPTVLLAPVLMTVVHTRWFLGGPVQWQVGWGCLVNFLALAALVLVAIFIDWGAVLVACIVFAVIGKPARAAGRFLARVIRR